MKETGELNALIVEHIADLEAAQRQIEEVLDPMLLREASAIMKKQADELGWVHELDKEDTISVAPEEWIERDEDGEINSWSTWFELSHIDADGELEQSSHLADFLNLQGGSTRKALSFYQDLLAKKKWRTLLGQQAKAVQGLRKLGFDVDEKKGSINLPVRLDATELKRGFQEDALEEALAPVGKALERAVEAMQHFKALVAAARRALVKK